MGLFSHYTNRSRQGSGPGGQGWGGWTTGSGQEWTPGGAMSPGDWHQFPSGPGSGQTYDQHVYNMQERGRDRFNHSQQSWFNQNPNSWFTQAEQIRQSSPEYWQRWMMPLYQQFGYGTPQVGPGGQSQMIPSVISGMLGS